MVPTHALGKSGKADTHALTDGAQVVLSKCVRRTDLDWFKYVPIYKSFNAYSWEYQTNFGGRILPEREGQKRCQQRRQTFPESM